MDSEINEADIEFLKFDLKLARKIGLNEAIVFERIRHWLWPRQSRDRRPVLDLQHLRGLGAPV